MTFATYEDVASYLNGLVDYEKTLAEPLSYDTKTFDLQNFRAFLEELGDPQLKYAAIHVAGTKGKGSTCAFLSSVLTSCGCKVGLYTSPHIDRYSERIQVDGKSIPEEDFARIVSRLSERSHFQNGKEPSPTSPVHSDKHNFRTVFELLTATAFLYFAEQEIDIAVVETGLGGRLDSTNVFDMAGAGPLVNVITAIGYDHTAILGHTIEEIAREKVAIIHGHSVAVLGPQPDEWGFEVQAAMEARLKEVGGDQYLDVAALIDGREAVEERPDGTHNPEFMMAEYTLDPSAAPPDSMLAQSLVHGLHAQTRLHGVHQIDNVRTCLGALLALENTQGFREWAATVAWRHPEAANGLTRGFPAECVRRGIARTRWPGRFEIVSRHPLDIVDGAHCPLSAEAMVNTFRDLYGMQQVILVAGFLRDKLPDQVCASIPFGLNVTAIVCCTPSTPRGLPAEEAARMLTPLFPDTPIEAVPDPYEAVRGVLQLRDEDQAVLIFGSMYIVGPARSVCREHSTAVSDFGPRV